MSKNHFSLPDLDLRHRAALRSILTVGLAALVGAPLAAENTVDFNHDVKPILASSCLKCHSGVKRKAGLNLVYRDSALSPASSGKLPIVPGKPQESELLRRVTAADPDERMPPVGEPLTPRQIEVLRTWIEQGAPYVEHWAYQPIELPRPPAVRDETWPRSELDRFVLARLEKEGIEPSPEANRPTLIRRLGLDLIGLPPTPAEVDTFLADGSEDAYSRLVERLLASPRYGERWASRWLDLARYADTQGYEKDNRRTIWRYRDWVIDAFNRDLPYDRFTIEQLAGDLLSDAGQDQLLATAFHRNTMTNTEGGTDDEEFRIAAVIDRVSTTWQVWMGTTFGCVQCHSHPYDPIQHEEFYEFLAFFNNTADRDRANEAPTIPTPTRWQREQLAELDEKIAAAQRVASPPRDSWSPELEAAFTEWDASLRAASTETQAASTEPKSEARASLPDEVLAAAKVPPAERDEAQARVFREHFLKTTPVLENERKRLAALQEERSKIDVPTTPILRELPEGKRRDTHVFVRGSFLSPGEEVSEGVPGFLHSLPEDERVDRLAMARWIVDERNPLTPRVAVNRVWEQLFGVGLVETSEDFGTQGAPPSHPELLDWLAWRFVHVHDWSQKRLIEEIVSSATYRQSSRARPELLERDPRNRLLARGSRFRLSAEMVRDQMLAVSGLLSEKMFGPSVMPPQPKGVWQVVYSGDSWKTSQGEDRYRRGLYTFWRRTSPHPAMIAFDATSREYCVVRRLRTNTPLQALVTLNDPVAIEAAQALARRVVALEDASPRERLRHAVRRCLLRWPTEEETRRLLEFHETELAHYRQHAEAARQIATEPLGPVSEDADLAQLAAWTVVSNVLLNLDEFLTRS